MRRSTSAVGALRAVGAVALSACGGNASPGRDDGGKDGAGASGFKIKLSAQDGATNAGINDTGVKVSGGRLTTVRLVQVDNGSDAKGSIAADGSSWKPAVQPERGTKYKVVANAKDAKGRTATESATFTTISSKNSFIGSYMPGDGSTVGVGIPVPFTFDKAITDKKDVQSHITVTSNSGQKVAGHWFGAQRLDFRPEQYWKAGSRVTLKIGLDGVKGGEGITGVQSETVSFTIGRSQVSTVDMNTRAMTVVRDGKTIKSIPISGGSPQNPTYNGQMTISEKPAQTRMDSTTVGFPKGTYDIPDVPHAMRLSNSGTFIHGNYWGNPPDFGRAGTSHGCVGLRDNKGGGNTPGTWFFDQSLIGDVVVVKNSPEGLNGRNMRWSQWQASNAA